MHAFSALLLDTYRQLNSQKLFWLTLMLSGLIALAFASVRLSPEGIAFLWFDLGSMGGIFTSDTIPPEQFYKAIFANFGIGIWLSWIATILALISTAGMIPSFIASGAVELTLSKPIRRTHLFLFKFLCGLLFTTLQVTAFTLACFLVIGIRGNSWEPSLFLAIPITVAFFSYLFAICALIGLVTRSTIAALLLTLLAWAGLFVINASDVLVLQLRTVSEMRVEQIETRVARMERAGREHLDELWLSNREAELRDQAQAAGTAFDPAVLESLKPPAHTDADLASHDPTIAAQRTELVRAQGSVASLKNWSRGIVVVKTILPKTTETIALLERVLVKELNLSTGEGGPPADDDQNIRISNLSDEERAAVQSRVQQSLRARSAWWILGTSLAFVGVLLTISCWIFARRDF